MRIPRGSSGGGGAPAGFGGPVIVVLLVLMLGGTIYLWRQRYMRRRTAYVTITILVAGLIYSGITLYTSNN